MIAGIALTVFMVVLAAAYIAAVITVARRHSPGGCS